MNTLFKVMPLLALILSACGVELRKNEVNSFHLERVRARVIRYNCQNEIESDRTEEVSEPSKWVNIEADSRDYLIADAVIKNLSLNPDSNGGMISYHPHRVSFLIHYSDTWLGYQVREGLNEIQYEFFSLNDTQLKSEEKGTIRLEIRYSERFDTEVFHYRPTPEDCLAEEGQQIIDFGGLDAHPEGTTLEKESRS